MFTQRRYYTNIHYYNLVPPSTITTLLLSSNMIMKLCSIEPVLVFLETRVRVPYLEGTWIDRVLLKPMKEAYIEGRKQS